MSFPKWLRVFATHFEKPSSLLRYLLRVVPASNAIFEFFVFCFIFFLIFCFWGGGGGRVGGGARIFDLPKLWTYMLFWGTPSSLLKYALFIHPPRMPYIYQLYACHGLIIIKFKSNCWRLTSNHLVYNQLLTTIIWFIVNCWRLTFNQLVYNQLLTTNV